MTHSNYLKRNSGFNALPPLLLRVHPMAEQKQQSTAAKHILLADKNVDFALLPVRNTPPVGHTFHPAQRLFSHTLHSELPQPSTTLEPGIPLCGVRAFSLHASKTKHMTSVREHRFLYYFLEAMSMPSQATPPPPQFFS